MPEYFYFEAFGQKVVLLKKMLRFWTLALILFSIFFSLSTIIYRVQEISVISVRKIYYGWPFQWLQNTTFLIPPSGPIYSIRLVELLLDIAIMFAISAAISYLSVSKDMNAKAVSRQGIGIRIAFLVIAAYLTRILSCAIHEVMGHGLWALAMGAHVIHANVTYLGFGWCSWEPPLIGIKGLLAIAGGIISSFSAGAAILSFLYYLPRLGGFYSRLVLFLLGFWITITQSSYLIVGGLTGYGDIGSISHSLGIVPLYFAALGVPVFVLVFFVVSVLFFRELGRMFPSTDQKKLLSTFWLTIPILVVTFALSEEFSFPLTEFALFMALSIIPSIMAFPMFDFFRKLSVPMDRKKVP